MIIELPSFPNYTWSYRNQYVKFEVYRSIVNKLIKAIRFTKVAQKFGFSCYLVRLVQKRWFVLTDL